jgi:hypothetical protein
MQLMILGSKILALVDSGAGVNIETTALSQRLQLPILYIPRTVSIKNAESGRIMKAIGIIDIGGYLGRMPVVPKAYQCLISTDVSTKRGLTVIFTKGNCIIQNPQKEAIVLMKQANGLLFYLNIGKFLRTPFKMSYSPLFLVYQNISPQQY